MLKYYSKPVLTNYDNSSYNENIYFKLTLGEPKILDEYVVINGKLDLNSEILTKLIKENKLTITLNVRTNLHSYTKNLTKLEFEEKIERDYLERIDLIRCRVTLSANSEIVYPHNAELKSKYDSDVVFRFFRDEKLAESNEERIDYMNRGEPFIHILKSPELDNKGLLFSCDAPNMIQIKVGPEFHNAFSKLQSERIKTSSKHILNSNLAFDAILYSLLNVIANKTVEIDKEKEWFKALDYCYTDISEDGETLADFIINMYDNIDVNKLFSVTQKMLNNQVEVKVVETWRSTL